MRLMRLGVVAQRGQKKKTVEGRGKDDRTAETPLSPPESVRFPQLPGVRRYGVVVPQADAHRVDDVPGVRAHLPSGRPAGSQRRTDRGDAPRDRRTP